LDNPELIPLQTEWPSVRHAVRASMGARFGLRIERFGAWGDYAGRHERAWHPFMSDAAGEVREVGESRPCSLIFGNESSGLAGEFGAVGRAVRIAHAPRIDSLNLALAVGIGLYELRRKRAGG
jgi:TrmH family RNA methyltransferase